MDAKHTDSQSSHRSESFFFPISIELSSQGLLVVGGGRQAYLETLKVLEYGAHVDVIASHMVAEFSSLKETHGTRINLLREKFAGDAIARAKQKKYVLIYALSYSDEENRAALELASELSALVYACDHLNSSTFVPPTSIKRGHLKLSASSDGISPLLEEALMQRIEANLISDIDKYVLFLSSLKEKMDTLKTSIEPGCAYKTARELASTEEILFALKRLNFDEALNITDSIIAEAVATSSIKEGQI
jgi:precorrin-2 dehydrogenase/sirohydrochlorin ferrochelatase